MSGGEHHWYLRVIGISLSLSLPAQRQYLPSERSYRCREQEQGQQPSRIPQSTYIYSISAHGRLNSTRHKVTAMWAWSYLVRYAAILFRRQVKLPKER